jgi:hypothetical protein
LLVVLGGGPAQHISQLCANSEQLGLFEFGNGRT